jgi:hypothetical protein
MAMRSSLSGPRLGLPAEESRRTAVWSLLMIGASVGAVLVAGVVGTVLQLAVFDLDDQEMLSAAGAWGVVAALALTAFMALPGLVGVGLGIRARTLGERRLGTVGIVVNALVVTYLGLAALIGLFG